MRIPWYLMWSGNTFDLLGIAPEMEIVQLAASQVAICELRSAGVAFLAHQGKPICFPKQA